MHMSGRYVGSVREMWSAWGNEMRYLGTAWAALPAVYAGAGNILPTAHPLEAYTSVYQKCQVLSLHDIMISVSCTTQALHLLSHPSPTQGHLCFKMGQQKCRLCFCHISQSSSSLSSLQTSPAAQQSCVPGAGADMDNRNGIRSKKLFFTPSQLKISERRVLALSKIKLIAT